MILIDFVFPKLRTPKTWIGKCLITPLSKDSSRSNMGDRRKHCSNLHQSTFIIFTCHCQTIELEMSKKSRLRKPIDKQHGKWAQTLLKAAPQHLYHIYGSLPRLMSWKKYLLLTCQILRLFANSLAANDKYSALNRYKLIIPVQMQLSQKPKTFSRRFSLFLNCSLSFEDFERKQDPHTFCVSNIYGLRKRKCLKSRISEDTSTSNIENGPKHCWNLHRSTFIIFIDHWQSNWVRKNISYWHAKS